MISNLFIDAGERLPSLLLAAVIALLKTLAATAVFVVVASIALLFAVTCLTITGRFPWFVRKWF